MTRAIVSLGSNLGDREATLRAAVRDIDALDGVHAVTASALVETAAWKPEGVDVSAPSYLNAIVAVQTSLLPEELLRQLNVLEATHGRVRDIRWGDRTLDLDIIDFDGLTSTDEHLSLPHPRAAVRDFVLAPWLSLEPDATLSGTPVADLLAAVGDTTTPYPAEPLL